MFNTRKTVFTKEFITADEMGQSCDQITRVAAMAVIRNPLLASIKTTCRRFSMSARNLVSH
ncbi:hypothetical protein [uncultured Roseobacter sp.]|uniref:hypothetical protein n=1 Tax=uncultured Roseobacter sp. TaxID=114847 RepID=UPI002614C1FE|nr:hypothetical protein [uncultured Roseobacter sp.]